MIYHEQYIFTTRFFNVKDFFVNWECELEQAFSVIFFCAKTVFHIKKYKN